MDRLEETLENKQHEKNLEFDRQQEAVRMGNDAHWFRYSLKRDFDAYTDCRRLISKFK